MSPTIRIDDEVYASLQAQASPFVDTPNSVIRRLLGLGPTQEESFESQVQSDEREPAAGSSNGSPAIARRAGSPMTRRGASGRAHRGKRTRTPSGVLLPESQYIVPLLETLHERGGSAHVGEVISAVGEKLGSRLTELDRSHLRSGGLRWQSRIQFVRLRLLERGLLKRNSPRGVWELSEEGEAVLKNGKKNGFKRARDDGQK